MSVAHTAHDSTAIAVIALNQAEVYIQLEQWDDATSVLQKAYENAKATSQKTQVAYLLSALGWLAQSQNDWARQRVLRTGFGNRP